jgi:hypothetical protein
MSLYINCNIQLHIYTYMSHRDGYGTTILSSLLLLHLVLNWSCAQRTTYHPVRSTTTTVVAYTIGYWSIVLVLAYKCIQLLFCPLLFLQTYFVTLCTYKYKYKYHSRSNTWVGHISRRSHGPGTRFDWMEIAKHAKTWMVVVTSSPHYMHSPNANASCPREFALKG